jgi:NAD(P)-dependent dehydrogenase (short-subunit alcohol dehydrogenase family)
MVVAGKVAIVTGAGHGIGRAIVEELLADGADVAFSYRNDKAGADALVSSYNGERKLRAYKVEELSDVRQCGDFFEQVKKDFGRIDIVVANASGAGAARGSEDLYNLDMDLWQDTLKDNLLVAITTAKFAIGELNKNETGGKIVFIGSVLGLEHVGNPLITAYSTGKAGTHSFAKTIAKALAPKILVNVVAPGRCWSAAYEGKDEAYVNAKFAVNRHGRPVDWKEISQAVRMVLENDSIIGQVINVDAGFSLRDA